jgi:hypothetical protein
MGGAAAPTFGDLPDLCLAHDGIGGHTPGGFLDIAEIGLDNKSETFVTTFC